MTYKKKVHFISEIYFEKNSSQFANANTKALACAVQWQMILNADPLFTYSTRYDDQ